MKVYKSWTKIKQLIANRHLSIQYEESLYKYDIFIMDGNAEYRTELWIDTTSVEGIDVEQNNTDKVDFEDNYKSDANKPISPMTEDRKPFVRSESRPLDFTTCFTMTGDTPTVIGGGTAFMWDANADNFIDNGDGTKTFKIDFGFKDDICIKEGSLYFFDAPWGAKLEFCTYIPAEFSPTQEDLFIDHFVLSHFMYGNCPMGDELNTECASDKIPSYIRHQFRITLPSADTACKGYISLELYRENTV